MFVFKHIIIICFIMNIPPRYKEQLPSTKCDKDLYIYTCLKNSVNVKQTSELSEMMHQDIYIWPCFNINRLWQNAVL